MQTLQEAEITEFGNLNVLNLSLQNLIIKCLFCVSFNNSSEFKSLFSSLEQHNLLTNF